jgi:hypothetical protein
LQKAAEELVAEQPGSRKELVQLLVAVAQAMFVGDDLRDLQRELKASSGAMR